MDQLKQIKGSNTLGPILASEDVSSSRFVDKSPLVPGTEIHNTHNNLKANSLKRSFYQFSRLSVPESDKPENNHFPLLYPSA
jgi:hypothetical protein